MKALTIRQPWASLIAMGAKTIETRSFRTKYRGPIAIHASKAWHIKLAQILTKFPFNQYDFGIMPLGAIVATADLVECESAFYWRNKFKEEKFPPYEREFGGYDLGRFGWRLANVKSIRNPIPAKGMLGLWNWEPPKAVPGSREDDDE